MENVIKYLKSWKKKIEELEQKDWEVIGISTIVSVIAVAFSPFLASVALGVVIGLSIQNKL